MILHELKLNKEALMPLFKITGNRLEPIDQTNFRLERDLQALVEISLQATFNCRLVASEFSTGSLHSGRIDTLALSEDNNPVIIEYKKAESSDLINQSLFYLHWIEDHRGDFEIAARNKLGGKVQVDWSNVRVICIAPNYKRYDIHAVQVMGASIELWKYRLFKNSTIHFEEVLQASKATNPAQSTLNQKKKNPIMVAAGKKAAIARATGSYSLESHLSNR